MFMMPMTFATEEFEVFVKTLNLWLEQITLESAQQSKSNIQSMCGFYTKVLEKMPTGVEYKIFMYSDKKHYKYDLVACEYAHKQLMLEDKEKKKYADQMRFRPV